VASRKPFLLRIEPEILAAYQRWAAQELRSVNGQIEYVLRRVLTQEGRLRPRDSGGGEPPEEDQRP
jgi:hypothetical protein